MSINVLVNSALFLSAVAKHYTVYSIRIVFAVHVSVSWASRPYEWKRQAALLQVSWQKGGDNGKLDHIRNKVRDWFGFGTQGRPNKQRIVWQRNFFGAADAAI